MKGLAFPNSPPTYLGNLPETAPGQYYDYEWLRRALALDAAFEAYEAVDARVNLLVIAASVLLQKALYRNSLSFKLGPLINADRRRILIYFNGYDTVHTYASVTVLLSEATGELLRPLSAELHCHDER